MLPVGLTSTCLCVGLFCTDRQTEAAERALKVGIFVVVKYLRPSSQIGTGWKERLGPERNCRSRSVEVPTDVRGTLRAPRLLLQVFPEGTSSPRRRRGGYGGPAASSPAPLTSGRRRDGDAALDLAGSPRGFPRLRLRNDRSEKQLAPRYSIPPQNGPAQLKCARSAPSGPPGAAPGSRSPGSSGHN